MKQTENLEQLLERFTKRTAQVKAKKMETQKESPQWTILQSQLDYLRGCEDTIIYLQTGKLPNDGNHDGMKDHKPVRHNDLGSLGLRYQLFDA